MSSLMLLLSGSLVASGLILGAFTLQGAFDPQWPQKMEAAARNEALDTFRTRTHFATRGAAKAGSSRDAGPAGARREAAARRRRAQKRAEERRGEKTEETERPKDPRQAALTWPWDWFGK